MQICFIYIYVLLIVWTTAISNWTIKGKQLCTL